MTLRLRYYLAVVPLFFGLGVANALLLYWLEKYEVVWGAGEQSKGVAQTIAAFTGLPDAVVARVSRPVVPDARVGRPVPLETAPHLRESYAQLARRLGGVSAAWFVRTADGWQATPLIETPGLRVPAAPAEGMIEALQKHEAVALLLERPEAPHDEAIGYAGVFADDGSLRAVVGASVPETLLRAERGLWIREGTVLVALVALLGWGVAEGLTRLARREIERLHRVAEELGRGDYTAEWSAGRIRELNDLGGTLRTMASLLGDSVHRARRTLLQADPLPRDADLAAAWQDACDGAPEVNLPAAKVLLHCIGSRHADDFLGARETPAGWVVVAGRLDPGAAPVAASSPIERIVRSTTARDYFLGLGARVAAGEAWPAQPPLFPCQHLDLIVVPTDGAAPLGVFAAGGSALPAPQPLARSRGIAGTLPEETRRFVAEFLQHVSAGELPLRTGELGALLASRGEGVLLVYDFNLQRSTL